eukprot:COSAG02_NODE_11405_length_1730_cov_1.383814_2_plen_64_part_00
MLPRLRERQRQGELLAAPGRSGTVSQQKRRFKPAHDATERADGAAQGSRPGHLWATEALLPAP